MQQVLYVVNMARLRHSKKEVEAALIEAENQGWLVLATSSGHRWGVLKCAQADRNGCQVSIWSTPKNSGNHAKQIRRFINRCEH